MGPKNTNSKMKRWKARLDEYDHVLIHKPGVTNVVADALSRNPKICAFTSTVHSAQEDNGKLILSTEGPINAFKNQIFIKLGNTCNYFLEKPFTNVHRHNIVLTDLSESKLKEIIEQYFSGIVINGIYCSENIMGSLQEVYTKISTNMRSKYSQILLIYVCDVDKQKEIIFLEHQRARRGHLENKLQIIKRYYWPKMAATVKQIVKSCTTCQVSKYTRHPDKQEFQDIPIPTKAMQMLQMDIFTMQRQLFITCIDCFTKYGTVRPIKSRALVDVKKKFFELISQICYPKSRCY